MRRTAIAVAAVVATGAIALGVGIAVDQDSAPHIVLGEGKDRLPSSTAVDWVTYADHVVIASPAEEEDVPPSVEEKERGEGTIGRKVTMKVDRVLWSRDQPERPAPTSWERESSGWLFDGTPEDRTEFALADRPRIELGHHYILALAWAGDRCSAGDETVPAHWVSLGAGATLPYDDNVIDNGEFEGRPRTKDELSAAASRNVVRKLTDDAEAPLREELAGLDSDALLAVLQAAEPAADDRGTAPAARSLKDTCD